MKRRRKIGTTEEAIKQAEQQLKRVLPPSFRQWLLHNNGLSPDGISIFPIFDERDPRTTWDSIVRQFNNGQWVPDYWDEDIMWENYLPFGSVEADTLCFDYTTSQANNELPVVLLSHETGIPIPVAESFAELLTIIEDKKLKF